MYEKLASAAEPPSTMPVTVARERLSSAGLSSAASQDNDSVAATPTLPASRAGHGDSAPAATTVVTTAPTASTESSSSSDTTSSGDDSPTGDRLKRPSYWTTADQKSVSDGASNDSSPRPEVPNVK